MEKLWHTSEFEKEKMVIDTWEFSKIDELQPTDIKTLMNTSKLNKRESGYDIEPLT